MKFENLLRIGKNNIDHVYDILAEYGAHGKILLLTEPFIDGLFGEKVKSQVSRLGELKISYVEDNSITFAMSMAEKVISDDIDIIVGLGGGRILDVCKYAAHISSRALVSIPTTMANDGIASPVSVLQKRDGKPKSLVCRIPDVIIVDTVLIKDSPAQLIKAGIGDILSNHMALMDWKFADKSGKDKMNDFAYLMSKASLDSLLNTNYDHICPEFINQLADSLVLSGLAMDFAGSSRPSSGSEHLFSHALDHYCQTRNLHGIQVALGTVAVSRLVGINCDHIVEFLKRFEVDINPASIGISKPDFVNCMQRAVTMRNRYTHLSVADLSAPTLEQLYDRLCAEL